MPQGYYWVVTYRNTTLHHEQNLFAGFRSAGRTGLPNDPLFPNASTWCATTTPAGKAIRYDREEVFRWDGDLAQFLPHPAFE